MFISLTLIALNDFQLEFKKYKLSEGFVSSFMYSVPNMIAIEKVPSKRDKQKDKKEDFEKKLMHDFHVGLFLLQFFCSMWQKAGSFYYTSFLISSIATHPGKQFFYFSYFNCQFSFCKFCQFNVYLFVCCLCCILFCVSFSVSDWFRLFEESTNQTQLV